MFRFQIYSLSVILLLGGAASFVLETQSMVHMEEERQATQLVAARQSAERAIDSWIVGNVNRAVSVANSAAISAQLKALRDADASARRQLFDGAVEKVMPALTGWREGIPGAERPDWIFVLDAEGRVILRSHAPSERSDSMVGIPLVHKMLGGAALDGVWVLEDGVYAVAAAATQVGSNIVGGVVLGYKITAPRVGAMASLMPEVSEGVSAGLALLWGGKTLGQSFVIEDGVVIPAATEPTEYGASQLNMGPLPLLAPPLGHYLGTAAPSVGWPDHLLLAVNVPHSAGFSAVAERQLFIIGATLVLFIVSIIWGLSIRGAVTKPLGVIVEHLSGVQRGANVGVLPEVALKEPYLRLGKLINMLITRGGPGGGRGMPSPTDLSDVLGGTPAVAPANTGDFRFDGIPGFDSQPPAPASRPADPAPMQISASDLGMQAIDDGMSGGVFDTSDGGQSGIASLFEDAERDIAPPPTSQPVLSPVSSLPGSAPSSVLDASGLGGDDFAAFVSPGDDGGLMGGDDAFASPDMGYGGMSAPAAARAAPAASAAPPNWGPERTVMVQVPEELLAASATSAAMADRSSHEEFNPEATVVAAVPDDLLQAAVADPDADPDEAHFHEVYEQFIATRKECGEPISDLSYDRFLIKLKKNREQLVGKYGCRTVRFQVYVKAGKAALKAVPVRD